MSEETLREKAARAINDSWIYSAHWDEMFWHKQALEDAKYRLSLVLQDKHELVKIIKKLEELSSE